MAFPDPGRHIIRKEMGDSSIVEVYSCEPYIYRQIAPDESDSGPYYFYWFLVEHVDTQTIVTNQSQLDELKSRLEASESAILGLMQMQLTQPM